MAPSNTDLDTSTRPPFTPSPEPLVRGSKTLLMGGVGSGKTTALTTFIEAGLEVFIAITDPGGQESLIYAMDKKNLPMDKLHWNYVASASPSWDTLMKMAQLINIMGYKELSEIKQGIDKASYQQFMELITLASNFKCERTGKEYGPVDFWGPDRVFAHDSLSGINTMAYDLMVGAKPTAHRGEYGVAMNAEEKFIKKCCADLKCFYVLTAHVDREPDEVGLGTKIMVSALGSKLAPKLPKDFSDVVYSYREGADYYWSTMAPNVDLKHRLLPLLDKLDPSFQQVVTAWQGLTRVVEGARSND